MNKQRTLIVVLVIIFLILVGFFIGKGKSEVLTEEQLATYTYVWSFNEKGIDEETGVPTTEVKLLAHAKEFDLGTFTGTCSEIIDTNWELLEDEQSGVICWFAGAGTEIGVFKEGKKLVIKKGLLEEGDAETQGIRGDFEKIDQI